MYYKSKQPCKFIVQNTSPRDLAFIPLTNTPMPDFNLDMAFDLAGSALLPGTSRDDFLAYLAS